MKSTRSNIYFYILDILIVITTFRGIINNFILINNGTILVDACIVIVILFTFTCKKIKTNSILYHYFLWIILCVLDLLVQFMINRTTFRDGILALRNDVVYTFSFVFILFCIKEIDLYKIFSLIRNLAFIINIFAIFQFVLRGILPVRFFVLIGESTFGFWNTDVIRVTGLMGNTIEYGGYVVLILSFIWAEMIVKEFKTPLLWVQLIVAVIANLLTFNRASIVGMVLVMLIEYILYIPRHKVVTAMKKYLILLVVAVIAIVIIFNYFGDSIIIQRLFNVNELWNKGSDEGHWKVIKDAIAGIIKYPVLGYGAGTVGPSALAGIRNIIRDGTLWTYMLEWGIPICIVYWLLVARIVKIAFVHRQDENKFLSSVSLGYIGSNAYLIGASVINSAYSARCTLILLWIYAGILLKEIYSSMRYQT